MKKIILSLFLLMTAVTMQAAPVSAGRALRLARTFWNHLSEMPAEKLTWSNLSPQAGYKELYLFTAGDEGFVMVAADDRVPPILGYSVSNPLNLEQMPVQLVEQLQGREKEIARCKQIGLQATNEIAQAWKDLDRGRMIPKNCPTQVLPLITTTWSQSPYYNKFAPVLPGGECPIGCVATAMGQLMKYWNYPIHGRGSHAYNGLQANFDTTYYDWTHMPTALNSSSTLTEVDAVATLLYHCAVSVDMQFACSGSGAVGYIPNGDTNYTCAPNSLRRYFRYASGMYSSPQGYATTPSSWCRRLRNELDMRRPLLYSGHTPSQTGHQFICDGYDYYGYFHFNWGWGGYADGYFLSTALNPTGNPEDFRDAFTNNTVTFNIRPAEVLRSSLTNIHAPQELWDTTFTLYSAYDDTAAWTLLQCPSWASLSQTTGTGAGMPQNLTLTLQANNTGAVRSGSLIFVQGDDTSTIKVNQLSCTRDEMCQIYITMTDSAGNGWEGAYLSFYSPSGYQYGFTTVAHTSDSITMSVCADSVYVAWNPGVHDSQCAYSISNSNGHLLFSDTGAYDAPVLLVNPCYEPPCETVDSLPWFEDFEDPLRYHCYQRYDADSDHRTWGLGNSTYLDQGHDGSANAAVSASYMNETGALTPDNWIVTPAIELPDTAPCYVSWWVAAHNSYDYAEHYSVLISTTGTEMTDFEPIFSETLTTAGYQQRFATLSDWQGETIHIAYRHHDCSNQYWISIDDIAIELGIPPEDTTHHDTTSIVQVSARSWQVYPNPARDVLTISSKKAESVSVSLYNTAGEDVLQRVERETIANLRLDISQLPAGVYMLKITSPKETWVRRVIILD